MHTSFVADNVIRLTRADIDASVQHLYPSDFFVDLIFTDARNQSNIILNMKHRDPESAKPEIDLSAKLHLNPMEEEKKLKQSSKQLNSENKDDFWITLSQSLLDAPQTFTS